MIRGFRHTIIKHGRALASHCRAVVKRCWQATTKTCRLLALALWVPTVLGVAAAVAMWEFGDQASPDGLSVALTALITLNAVVVGLAYATMRRAAQMLAGNDAADVFRWGTVWMSVGSLAGVFLAITHLGWQPLWSPLPITVGLLVFAPVMTPLLAVQENLAAQRAAATESAAQTGMRSQVEYGEETAEGARGMFDGPGRIRVRAREFVAEPSNPFEHDVLGRETHVRSFCAVLAGVQSPAVISVDAGWGEGKTAFLKMCAALMRSDCHASSGVAVAEFNAWTQNYHNDPLKDIVSAVTSQITDTADERDKRNARLLRQAAAQVAAGGLLPDEIFADENSARQDVEDFKKALADHAAGNGGKLVVFVDELDRCQPDYALRILERIRHLFDVVGVLVVIAVNPEALHLATPPMHDPDRGEHFLRRLIDQRMRLPKCDEMDTIKFVDHTCGQAGLLERWTDQGYTQRMLHSVTRLPGTSLRDIEQIIHRVALVAASLSRPTERIADGAWAWEQTAMALIVLRRVDEEAYWALVSDGTEVITAIQALKRGPALDEPILMMRLEVLLLLARHGPWSAAADELAWQSRYSGAGWADEIPQLEPLLEQFSSQLAGDEPDIRHLASIIELTTYDPATETIEPN